MLRPRIVNACRVFPAIVLTIVVAGADPTSAVEKDPKVPPGKDPGGVPVALIGPGIEYRLPQIANRLARDGEGEIIGYDFIDDDRRPLGEPDALQEAGYEHAGTAAARILLKEAGASTIVALRADMDDPVSVGKAIAYGAQGPARVIAIQASTELLHDGQVLVEAAAHFKSHLFIISAGDGARDLDENAATLSLALLDNVLIVTAATATGETFNDANTGAKTVSVASDATALTGAVIDDDTFSFKPNTGIAMARVAALAARLREIEPALDGAGMKVKILTFAKVRPATEAPRVLYGFIEKPWLPFRLE